MEKNTAEAAASQETKKEFVPSGMQTIIEEFTKQMQGFTDSEAKVVNDQDALINISCVEISENQAAGNTIVIGSEESLVSMLARRMKDDETFRTIMQKAVAFYKYQNMDPMQMLESLLSGRRRGF